MLPRAFLDNVAYFVSPDWHRQDQLGHLFRHPSRSEIRSAKNHRREAPVILPSFRCVAIVAKSAHLPQFFRSQPRLQETHCTGSISADGARIYAKTMLGVLGVNGGEPRSGTYVVGLAVPRARRSIQDLAQDQLLTPQNSALFVFDHQP
jgi:hypothetical protein